MDTASEEDAGRLVSLLYNLTKCVKRTQILLDSLILDSGELSPLLVLSPLLQMLQVAIPH